ncbi:MAG: hypothetical protein ACOX5Z_10325 [Desulfobulbus sp.]|jgi:hypothetical protein
MATPPKNRRVKARGRTILAASDINRLSREILRELDHGVCDPAQGSARLQALDLIYKTMTELQTEEAKE